MTVCPETSRLIFFITEECKCVVLICTFLITNLVWTCFHVCWPFIFSSSGKCYVLSFAGFSTGSLSCFYGFVGLVLIFWTPVFCFVDCLIFSWGCLINWSLDKNYQYLYLKKELIFFVWAFEDCFLLLLWWDCCRHCVWKPRPALGVMRDQGPAPLCARGPAIIWL